MSRQFRECATLWNSGAPRNSRALPGRKRIGVSPAPLVDPNPLSPTLSRRREREIDDHSTSRANHYFRREHLDMRGGNCEPILLPVSRPRETGSEDHRISRTYHYFRHGHLARRLLDMML